MTRGKPFLKGHKINKGKKLSEDHRQKISIANRGRIFSSETKKKISEAVKAYYIDGGKPSAGMSGKKHSEETKQKIRSSIVLRGIKYVRFGQYKNCEVCNKEYYIKLSQSHLRRTCSRECSAILHGKEKSGENHWKWRGGVTTEHTKIRMSIEYRLWREAVFARDNWTCQECGIKGGELHPHHIKPFALYPELRFAIDNGQTLCVVCHLVVTREQQKAGLFPNVIKTRFQSIQPEMAGMV